VWSTVILARDRVGRSKTGDRSSDRPYRHALRAAELVDLRWSQVDFDNARLHVRRVKNGIASVHPIKGDELRALRRLKREAANAEFVFVSERGAPPRRQGSRG
jgi:integrase